MRLALTRQVSQSFEHCLLTHLEHQPIDLQLARKQHAAYEQILAEHGCQILQLPEQPDMPDAVFVEDIALVFDELAVIARPGAAVRRLEVLSVMQALRAYRPVFTIEDPGTLDGGDVLWIDRTLYVGLSSRTNSEGIGQLEQLAAPSGYRIVTVPVEGCLHLKSAVTQVGAGVLLLHPGWIDATLFAGFKLLEVDPDEPLAANALLVDETVIYPQAFPATKNRLVSSGIRVQVVDVSELGKAEGGVTCCSLIFTG
jgi:dimethylargininase